MIVFVNVFGLLAIILDEKACASLFRNKRWDGNISCPHCKSNDTKKYGKYAIHL